MNAPAALSYAESYIQDSRSTGDVLFSFSCCVAKLTRGAIKLYVQPMTSHRVHRRCFLRAGYDLTAVPACMGLSRKVTHVVPVVSAFDVADEFICSAERALRTVAHRLLCIVSAEDVFGSSLDEALLPKEPAVQSCLVARAVGR